MSSWWIHWITALLTLFVDPSSPVYFAMRHIQPWSSFDSMHHYPYHLTPMDPQVCPPPLNSSQSVISSLDKSPASTCRPGHSRNSSTGSSKHSKQVTSLKSTLSDSTLLLFVSKNILIHVEFPNACIHLCLLHSVVFCTILATLSLHRFTVLHLPAK